MKKTALFAFSIASALVLSACNESETQGSDNPSNQGNTQVDIDFSSHKLAIQQASSCDDYREHLLDATAKHIANLRFRANDYYYDDIADDEAESSGSASNSQAESSSAGDYTVTNTQESGVDELDSVKNDGTYMYAIENGKIHITRVWPANTMEALTSIKSSRTDNHYAYFNGILLDTNRLIVIESSGYGWYSNNSKFTVSIYDVTDPAKPALMNKHQIDGYFEDARLINHRLFIASSNRVQGDWYELYKLSEEDIPGVPRFTREYDWNWDWDSKERKEYLDAADAWNDKYDENVTKYLPVIRAWLNDKYPSIKNFDWPQYSDGKVTRDALSCTDLYIPATTSSESGLLMVSEFSGTNYENFKASAVADNGWLVYASAQNLYLVSNSYSWWWNCDDDDESCKGYSHIHHFSLGENDGGLKYVNSGEVDGYVNDTFNLSDYQDHLRVVSSHSYWGNSPDGHKLSILDNKSPRTMALTGSVDGFGKGERLYSARLLKDKGYVVTFKNTDPLFTFDLSDPKAPKIAGELKINGYSSYIHPIGDTHLLTIGEDANENGRVIGMKLELFDVSNINAPKSAAKILINEEEHSETGSSYGWSSALYDHHALNFHEASGLLAVPVTLSKWSYTNDYSDWNYTHFSGMFVYRVTPSAGANAFEFVGGVNHSPLVGDEEYWWTNINRARFMFKDKGVYDKNAYLYTISNHGIMASDANKPDTMISSIKF